MSLSAVVVSALLAQAGRPPATRPRAGRGPQVSFSIGPLLASRLTTSPRTEYGAEAAFWLAGVTRAALGVDFGWTNHGLYSELQLAGELRGAHDWGAVLGASAGAIRSSESRDHPWGVQATLWLIPVLQFPSPLFPYLRAVGWNGRADISVGVMLKIGLPVYLP